MRRDDSDSTTHFQAERFFLVSGQWYFTTREGEDFGPFENRAKAEAKLSEYLETQSVMHRLRDRDPRLTDNSENTVKKIAELARDIQNERQGKD
jgi:hypothetical protein